MLCYAVVIVVMLCLDRRPYDVNGSDICITAAFRAVLQGNHLRESLLSGLAEWLLCEWLFTGKKSTVVRLNLCAMKWLMEHDGTRSTSEALCFLLQWAQLGT